MMDVPRNMNPRDAHWCEVIVCRFLCVHTGFSRLNVALVVFEMVFTSPALVEADAHWAVTVRSPDTRTSPRSEASIPGHLLIRERYIIILCIV